MRKIKLLTLGMALTVTAFATRNSSATTTCEADCYRQYQQCQIICSKNPCFVPCSYTLNACLNNCGSES